MADETRVYLDHLIARENFRYTRPAEEMQQVVASPSSKLTLKSLQDRSRAKLLRKPDFQRATWAWSPEDCVLLLETIVKNQVVPSIIMWSSPANGLDYILDGGHRVSVALAWLYDDWGDGPEADLNSLTNEQAQMIRKAAAEVRALVNARIGTIDDYRKAEQDLYKVIINRGNPSTDLDPVTFQRGLFYQNLLKDNVGFDIQYVVGNYQLAEESFLKINKSGRQLAEWEMVLIKNRNSSFARTVMAVANIKSAEHYWPGEKIKDGQEVDKEQKAKRILNNVMAIHDTLFKPEYQTPIRALRQPFLVAPTGDRRPFYLAELFTIVAGGKGQDPETEELLKKDADKGPSQVVENGLALTNDIIDVLEHLWAPFPDQPAPNQSLALVSSVYFYTNAGRPVRGLLYGLIYWLFNGDEQVVRERKRIFSAYRGVFEQIFLDSKEDIIGGFSRNVGSGPEVTIPVARYFNKLLSLLIQHSGDINDHSFLQEYSVVLNEIMGKKARSSTGGTTRGRLFTPRQRSISILGSLLTSAYRCGICGGILDPSGPVQHDHVQPASQGGVTDTTNQRITHPFCNNQRQQIEAIKEGQRIPSLPPFSDPDLDNGVRQLKLFDDGFLTSPW